MKLTNYEKLLLQLKERRKMLMALEFDIAESMPPESWEEVEQKAKFIIANKDIINTNWIEEFRVLNTLQKVLTKYQSTSGYWYYYQIKAVMAERYETCILIKQVLSIIKKNILSLIELNFSSFDEEDREIFDEVDIKYTEVLNKYTKK
jgi:hypothetical protein